MAIPIIAGGLLGALAFTLKGAFAVGLVAGLTRLVLVFGIGFVSFSALKPLIDGTFNYIYSLLTFNDAALSAFVGIIQLDVILTIWASAFATKLALTSIKKMVFK